MVNKYDLTDVPNEFLSNININMGYGVGWVYNNYTCRNKSHLKIIVINLFDFDFDVFLFLQMWN